MAIADLACDWLKRSSVLASDAIVRREQNENEIGSGELVCDLIFLKQR
jgi:hypothetical protein